ncbi:MAG: phage tail protein [Myxococcota bacterium]
MNEVVVEYGPDRDGSAFRFRVILSALNNRQDDDLAGRIDDTRVVGSYRAELSQRQFGRRTQTLQASVIWDPATAARIAQDVLTRQALPQRFVDYLGGSELEALDVGQVVTITDTEVGLSDQLAWVLDLEVGGPDVLLSLQLLDDPVVFERSTT